MSRNVLVAVAGIAVVARRECRFARWRWQNCPAVAPEAPRIVGGRLICRLRAFSALSRDEGHPSLRRMTRAGPPGLNEGF